MSAVPRSRYWVFPLVVGGLLTADLVSKSWVFNELGYEHRSSEWRWSTPLLWGQVTITLRTSFNRGALFGVGQGYTFVFALLSLLACAGIVYWLFLRGEARSLGATLLMALISAGALGNLHDRLGFHGCLDEGGRRIHAVRDFIDCTIPGIRYRPPVSFSLLPEYDWPIFNFADVFLVVGTASLVAAGTFSKGPPGDSRPPAAEHHA